MRRHARDAAVLLSAWGGGFAARSLVAGTRECGAHAFGADPGATALAVARCSAVFGWGALLVVATVVLGALLVNILDYLAPAAERREGEPEPSRLVDVARAALGAAAMIWGGVQCSKRLPTLSAAATIEGTLAAAWTFALPLVAALVVALAVSAVIAEWRIRSGRRLQPRAR